MTDKEHLRLEIDASLRYHSDKAGQLMTKATLCWTVMGVASVVAVVEPMAFLALPVAFAWWFAFAHPRDVIEHQVARSRLVTLDARVSRDTAPPAQDIKSLWAEYRQFHVLTKDIPFMDQKRREARVAAGDA